MEKRVEKRQRILVITVADTSKREREQQFARRALKSTRSHLRTSQNQIDLRFAKPQGIRIFLSRRYPDRLGFGFSPSLSDPRGVR
jgi:hypothetical protein